MKKRNRFLPLFLSYLLIPTTLDAAIVDLNKYTTNQKSNHLIASPGGHGKTREEKRKKKEIL
mgnify:CR=1 FL=1